MLRILKVHNQSIIIRVLRKTQRTIEPSILNQNLKMDDDNPKAYAPAPGDKDPKDLVS